MKSVTEMVSIFANLPVIWADGFDTTILMGFVCMLVSVGIAMIIGIFYFVIQGKNLNSELAAVILNRTRPKVPNEIVVDGFWFRFPAKLTRSKGFRYRYRIGNQEFGNKIILPAGTSEHFISTNERPNEVNIWELPDEDSSSSSNYHSSSSDSSGNDSSGSSFTSDDSSSPSSYSSSSDSSSSSSSSSSDSSSSSSSSSSSD